MSSTGWVTPIPADQKPVSVVCCAGTRVAGGMKLTPGEITRESPTPGCRVKVGKIARWAMCWRPAAERRRASASRTSGRRCNSSPGTACGEGGGFAAVASVATAAVGSMPRPIRISS